MTNEEKRRMELESHYKPLYTREAYNSGYQHVYKFPNLYGASIVCPDFLYRDPDHSNLAVLKFADKEDREGELCYDTAITEDVIGCLTTDECNDLLTQIKALDPKDEKQLVRWEDVEDEKPDLAKVAAIAVEYEIDQEIAKLHVKKRGFEIEFEEDY